MNALVECRSDWEYAQRPLAFTWQGQHLAVQEIIADYITPYGKQFIVETHEQGRYTLDYHENRDDWIIQPSPSKESA